MERLRTLRLIISEIYFIVGIMLGP